MRVLDISEVSRQSSVPVSTLRFYEEKRLIRSVGRRRLHRQFDAAVLDRLALIALGQSAGFSLEEISHMFTANGQLQIDRQLLVSKACAGDVYGARVPTDSVPVAGTVGCVQGDGSGP